MPRLVWDGQPTGTHEEEYQDCLELGDDKLNDEWRRWAKRYAAWKARQERRAYVEAIMAWQEKGL